MLTQRPQRSLAAIPRVLRFSAVAKDLPGLDALKEHLQRQTAARPWPIRHPTDILLGQQGQLRSNFRLTTSSLRQLCQLLAPGLYQLILNLSGLKAAGSGVNVPEISAELAVEIINRLIRLRFEQVRGKGLIINEAAGLVEGIVGSRYGFFSHLDFLGKCQETAAVAQPRGVFHEAILVGRRLAIRFRDGRPWFAHPDMPQDEFYGGSHFVNSEVGDCAVRAAHLVIRMLGDTKAMSLYSPADRLNHVKGRTFYHRLDKLMLGARGKAPEAAYCVEQLRLLSHTILWDGGADGLRSDRYTRLSRQLAIRGLRAGFVRRTLNTMLTKGSYPESAIPLGSLQAPGVRTAFDLYNALGVTARRERIGVQEEVEQLAYKLLTGRASLNSFTGETTHGQE